MSSSPASSRCYYHHYHNEVSITIILSDALFCTLLNSCSRLALPLPSLTRYDFGHRGAASFSQALSRLNPQRVEEFATLLNDGYQLDSFERVDWREFYHHTPFDIEPFATARNFVDLPYPSKSDS